jgi:copper chaperone CopZ
MTCAHVVHVSLKKITGVDSVDVSLNKGLAVVKLKQGNAVTIPQLWETIHKQGYTPKATTAVIRGELIDTRGVLQLKVSGTGVLIAVVPDATSPSVYQDRNRYTGHQVIVRGVMNPGKDFNSPVPLQITGIELAGQKGL